MIRLLNYGRMIDLSIYLFNNGILNSVMYTYDDNEKTIIVNIGEENGELKRTANFCREFFSKIKVDNFDLKVDEGVLFNSHEDLGNIIVKRYDTSLYRNDKQYIVNIERPDGKEIAIYVDKLNIAVWNRRTNTVRIYNEKNDEIDYSNLVEEIRVTEFGVISNNIKDKNIIVIYNNGDTVSYDYDKFYSNIDCLRNQCKIITLDDRKYRINYTIDGLVETVMCNDEIFSRSEVENIKYNGNGDELRIIYETMYPAMIMENFLNYKYKYLALWKHDRMVKTTDGDILSFESKTYEIYEQDKLLKDIRSNSESLIINY